MSNLPNIDRAWELMELAYPDGIKVMGWADNAIMEVDGWCKFNTYTDRPRSHEDQVIVLAIRVPHPDYMSFEEVIGGREEILSDNIPANPDSPIPTQYEYKIK